MDLGGADAVDAAFDALTVQLRASAEAGRGRRSGGLRRRSVGRVPAGLRAVPEPAVAGRPPGRPRGPERRSWPDELCHSTLPRALAATLRISVGEAGRRVRAADALTERMSMTGQPLEPVRPHLAAAQRDGEVSPEQVDIVERALAKVSGSGSTRPTSTVGEQMLAEYAGQFGPKDLQTAGRAGGRRHRPGRHPARRQAAGRSAALHAAPDAGRRVCRGVPADRRSRGEAAGRPRTTGEAPHECHRDRGREAGRGTGPADLRAADARRPRSRCATGCSAATASRMPVGHRRR